MVGSRSRLYDLTAKGAPRSRPTQESSLFKLSIQYRLLGKLPLLWGHGVTLANASFEPISTMVLSRP